MPGKLDHPHLEEAIARLTKLRPEASAIREHLASVLASTAFRGSSRSCEFLQFVVDHALNGEFDQLKERMIGITLFHREPTYDTNADSIVRVTASEVRKRLTQYYAEPDRDAPYRIELPAGSYIPEVHPRQFTQLLTGDPEPDMPEPLARGTRHPLLYAVVALAVFGAGWMAGVLSGRSGWMSPAGPQTAPYSFYRHLLGSMVSDAQHPTEIVLSNPRVLLVLGSDRPDAFPPGGRIVPVPPSLDAFAARAANDVQGSLRHHFLDLADAEYTGIGEAVAAFHVGRILQTLDRPVRLRQSRFLNWESTRGDHLIILGAPHMSDWAQGSLHRSNFMLGHDQIENSEPGPGEAKSYPVRRDQQSRTVVEDYGLIWMAQGPAGTRQLLLAAMSSAGTAGVGEFFGDPHRMQPVYEKLAASAGAADLPSGWQVLLKIKVRDRVPVEASYVAHRVSGK